MIVGVAQTGDVAEAAGAHLIPQEAMHRYAAPEVAGLEQDAGIVNSPGHDFGVALPHAQRLLDEHVLAGGGGGQHQLLVQVGLGADDDGRDGGVGPDRIDLDDLRAVKVRGTFGRPFLVMVPNGPDFKVGTVIESPHKAGGVDMGATDQRKLLHGVLL